MSSDRHKYLLSTLFSLLAVAISWKSCSNSNEALRLSKSQFIEANRPYLRMKPVKFKNSEDYLIIQRINNIAEIILRYKIHNVGKVPATNISIEILKNELNIGNKGVTNFSNVHKDFVLGPDDDISIEFKYTFPSNSKDDTDNYINMANSDKWNGITIDLKLSYTNGSDNNVQYTTELSDKIWKNKARPVRTVMKTID